MSSYEGLCPDCREIECTDECMGSGGKIMVDQPKYQVEDFVRYNGELAKVTRSYEWSGGRYYDVVYLEDNFALADVPEDEICSLKYSVGKTPGEGIPCVIEDGDSVLCVFPQNPESVAMDRARQVANILNGLEGLPE